MQTLCTRHNGGWFHALSRASRMVRHRNYVVTSMAQVRCCDRNEASLDGDIAAKLMNPGRARESISTQTATHRNVNGPAAQSGEVDLTQNCSHLGRKSTGLLRASPARYRACGVSTESSRRYSHVATSVGP